MGWIVVDEYPFGNANFIYLYTDVGAILNVTGPRK